MRFALSEDQVLLQDSLKRALTSLSPLDRVRRFADGGETSAPDIWAGLTDLGLPGLLVPEEHGGLGLGLLEAALAAEPDNGKAHALSVKVHEALLAAPFGAENFWYAGWLRHQIAAA